ncbi:unnamed protein product [Rotaria sp. Silwood1]|nr:unnamed protein product [Rotaria sp. Silwood1]
MNSPEWITVSIGCIACVLNGAAQPLFAFLLVKIVEAFKYCAASERRQHVLVTSFLFLLLGTVLFVLRFFQYTAFAISGSKLTQRIRSKAFASLLRQEVAYFDRPENNSGAICTRLSSDASAIQEMTGARLGVLAVEVIHNMRTIKQLSIEKEVLRQYSELIHKLFISSWKLLSSRIAASVSAAEAFFDLFDRKPAIDNTSTEGQELLLDGIDIQKLNLQWVRSHFGLVSQEPILFDLTITENIAYGLENVPMEDVINAASRANIHQFISQLPQGYETKVGLKGSFLSGGEKQRIAIARVLLRRPKVLLLDEATSAMDSHNEQIVQEALEQAQREDSSRTSFIIAHRLSTIRSCDLICVLERGHIVESGTHTELTQRRGAYYKMLAQSNLP